MGRVEDMDIAADIAAGTAMDVDSIHYFGSRTCHSVLFVDNYFKCLER